jgi:hypothetical protein
MTVPVSEINQRYWCSSKGGTGYLFCVRIIYFYCCKEYAMFKQHNQNTITVAEYHSFSRSASLNRMLSAIRGEAVPVLN